MRALRWIALAAAVVVAVALLLVGAHGPGTPSSGARDTGKSVQVAPSATGLTSTRSPRDSSSIDQSRSDDDTAVAFRIDVADTDGAPIEGAQVEVHELPLHPRERVAPLVAALPEPADDAGTVLVRLDDTGRYRLIVSAPGYADDVVDTAWVSGDPPTRHQVRLARGAIVVVRVVEPDGDPIPDAVLDVSTRTTAALPWLRSWRLRTDAEGVARVSTPNPGRIAVRAQEPEGDEWIHARVPEIDELRVIAERGAGADAPPRQTFTARVVDAAQEPVVGAEVRFHTFRGPVDGATDDDGRCITWTFSNASTPIFSVEARAANHAPVTVSVAPASVTPGGRWDGPTLVLGGATLEGVVTGPDGPVRGATVTVWIPGARPFGRMDPVCGRTDDSGHYRVHGLPAGTLLVEADAPGFDPVGADEHGNVLGWDEPSVDDLDDMPESAVVRVEAGRTTRRDLELVRYGPDKPLQVVINGRVTTADGCPVPWATVVASGSRDHMYRSNVGEALTNLDGRYRLEASAPNLIFLEVDAAGFERGRRSLDVEEDGEYDGFDIVLEPLPTARGTVRSAIDLPVAGAQVLVGTSHWLGRQTFTRWERDMTTVVGTDGSFAIPIAPRRSHATSKSGQGDGVILAVLADGHAPRLSPPFTRKELTGGLRFDIVLDAGASITGRATDPAGAPLAGANVRIGPRDPRDWPPAFPPMPSDFDAGRTGSDGAFALHELPPGTYHVEVRHSGLTGESVSVEAPADVRLRTAAIGRITGRILGPDGRPVVARVAARYTSSDARGSGFSDATESGPEGRFVLDGIAAGSWTLDVDPVSDALLPRAVHEVLTDSSECRIEVAPSLILEGVLLDAEGAPVPGVLLTVDAAPDASAPGGLDATDGHGRFAVRGLAPGPHRVVAPEHGWTWYDADPSAPVHLELGGASKLLVDVRVVDAAGGRLRVIPVLMQRVLVELSPTTAARGARKPSLWRRLIEDERLPFEHLADASYRLRVTPTRFEWEERSYELDGPAERDVRPDGDPVVLTFRRLD